VGVRFSIFHVTRGQWQRWRHWLVEWLSLLLLIALIVIPLSILTWLVFFTDTFVVRAITVVDARDHTAQAVRGLADPLLEKNILFIQTPVLEQRLLADIPQIRDIHIVRKLPGTLKIIVQEKTPALLLLSNAKYYFVDGDGIAYEEARLDTLPGTVLPIVKNNDQQARVTLGRPAVESAFIGFVQEAQETAGDIVGAQVAEIRIPSLAAREVHYTFDNNWLIRFDTTRPLVTQLGVLQRLLEHTIPEERKETIEYIDLRISNRVYFKNKSDVVAN
jgi:cell division septal protein FtsQ